MDKSIYPYFEKYCREELDIENPTKEDVEGTWKSHCEQAGSVEAAEDMMRSLPL